MIARRSVRATGACALLLMSASLPAMAIAQVAGEIAPPERALVDENGVNVATGTFRSLRANLAVGSGVGALTDSRIYGRQSWQGARIELNDTFPSASVVVLTGDKMYRFDRSGNGFQAEPDGSRLIRVDGVYQLILSDGTRYTYGYFEKASRHQNGYVSTYDAYAYLSSVEDAQGMRLDLHWESASYCPHGGTFGELEMECRPWAGSSWSGPPPTIWLTRLQAVSNSAGYRIYYEYAGSFLGGLRTPTAAEISAWSRLTGAQGGNAHGGIGPLPRASYAYSRAAISGGYLATDDVTDVLGRTWRYTKQVGGSGNFEAIRRPGSSSDNIRYNMDAGYHVTSIVRDGATWTYTFSAPSPTTSALTVTDPTGRTRKYQSDTVVGLPTRIEDEYGRASTFDYEKDRLKTGISPGGQVTTFEYDADGNVLKTTVTATDGTAMASSATYESYPCPGGVTTCSRLATSTDQRGVVTSYSYGWPHGGTTAAVTQNSGGTSPSTQTRYGQVAGVWMPQATWTCRTQASCENTADAIKTTVQYNANLLPVSVTTGAGDNSLTATWTTAYTAAGDVLTVDGPLPGQGDVTRYYYDAARQPLGAVGPDPDGSGPRLRSATRLDYDGAGRQTGTAQGAAADQGDAALATMTVGQTQTATLDAAGRLTSSSLSAGGPILARVDYGYDTAGRLTCTAQRMNPATLSTPRDACALGPTGAFGPDRVSLIQYGPVGSLAGAWTSVTNAYGTADAATETVQQTATGRPAWVRDGNGNVTAYGYDGFDRPTATTYPDGSYERTGYVVLASPTARPGDMSGVRLRDGTTVTFGYDTLGRQTTTAFNIPIDVTDSNLTYTYDLLGQVTSAQDSNGHNLGYARDSLGRVTAVSSVYGTLTSQYDPAGRRTRLTWNDGFFVTYEYDVVGAMTALRENGGPILASYAYDDLGRRISRTLGNGTSTTYRFDAASRLTALTLEGGNQPAATTLDYNPAGQITGRATSNNAYAWNGAVNADRAYAVNGLNQYTASGSITPTYDARGEVTPVFHPAATRGRPALSRMSAGEATGEVNPARCR